MSSKNRRFRKKAEDLNNPNEDQAANQQLPIRGLATPNKVKDKKPKKVSLLSFDEEESGSPGIARVAPKDKVKAKLRPNLQGLDIKEEPKSANTQQSGAGKVLSDIFPTSNRENSTKHWRARPLLLGKLHY